MAIESDIEQEARRIIAAGEAQGLRLRLLGGLAIRLHAPSATREPLVRAGADIDLVTDARSHTVERLLSGLGYLPDREFNLLHGATRLLFHAARQARRVDVFVGRFEMCHRLPITARLALEPLTLPLAELLLTKLQIVQLNAKDLRDIAALLLDHPVADGDAETINALYIARLCASDWGLWRTVTGNLDTVRTFVAASGLDAAARALLDERIAALRAAIDAAPKSFKWKSRAVIGERARWYELPEEVARNED